MPKFRVRNPFTSVILLNLIENIKHTFKYLLGLEEYDNETECSDDLLPSHHKTKESKEQTKYRRVYVEQHMMDGRVFLSLTDENGLPALQVSNLDDAKQIMFVTPSSDHKNGTNGHTNGKNGHANGFNNNGLDHENNNGKTNGHKNGTNNDVSFQVFEVVPANKSRRGNGGRLDPEMWKLGLAVCYIVCVHFISTFCIIVAQERLPDKTQYRPLPDMILDRVPYIPWAYRVTEGIIYLLFFIFFPMLVFHKNRFIVLRRGLLMSGSVYLLRALCIVMTSLPMPQAKYDCDKLIFTNNRERVMRALVVYLGMGMKVTGMKTCGDYMFSGHTVIIALLIYFTNHYSPRRWVLLHITVWLLGLTGIAFIFLSHGHYSIDIIIAFFIVSRMFFSYHVIADNMDLIKRRRGLMRTRFPSMYLVENNNQGIVPNEYEWPFPTWKKIKRYFRGKSITDYITETI